jgi:hypothetical protein
VRLSLVTPLPEHCADSHYHMGLPAVQSPQGKLPGQAMIGKTISPLPHFVEKLGEGGRVSFTRPKIRG